MRNHAPIALLRINEPRDVSTERRSQRHIDGSRNVAILGGPGEGFGAGHPRSAAPAEKLSSVTPMSSQAVTIVPRRTQLIAAMSVGFSLLAIGGRRAAAQIGTVSCHDSGNVTTCRIDQPNVTQRSSQYRNVVFRPNDAVVVTAGGCVQTGGVGSTWKRYVNPSGPNADHLYHGLINIPGNPPGGALVRIQTVVGRRLLVPASSPAASNFLTLGYEDDDYGGNGY